MLWPFQPGGGQVKIESRKLDWKAKPKTEASNVKYVTKGTEENDETDQSKANNSPGPKPGIFKN